MGSRVAFLIFLGAGRFASGDLSHLREASYGDVAGSPDGEPGESPESTERQGEQGRNALRRDGYAGNAFIFFPYVFDELSSIKLYYQMTCDRHWQDFLYADYARYA